MGSRLRGAWKRFVPHAPYAGLAAATAAFYAPVVANVYGFSTDYWLALHARLRDGALQTDLVEGAGRPIAWVLLELSFMPAGGVPGLTGIRILGLLLLCALAFALGTSVAKPLGRWPALALTGTVMLLPSTATVAYWASCWPMTVAALVCLGSVRAARKAAEPDLERRFAAAWSIVAVAGVVAALLIDRAAWGFVPAFGFLLLVAPAPERAEGDEIKRVAALGGGGFLLALLLSALIAPGMRDLGSGLLDDPLGRLGWFAAGPLLDGALAVWAHARGMPAEWIGVAVSALLNVSLCGVWLWSVRRRTDTKTAARTALGFLVCLAAAALPILTAKDDWTGYRPLWPLALLWVCPVVLGAAEGLSWAHGRGRRALITAAVPLGACALVAALLAHERLRIDLVGAQAQEWTLARFQAADAARTLSRSGAPPASLGFRAPESGCRWAIPGEAIPTSSLAWARAPLVTLAADGLPEAERWALLSLPMPDGAAKAQPAAGSVAVDMRLAAFYGSMIPGCDPFGPRP